MPNVVVVVVVVAIKFGLKKLCDCLCVCMHICLPVCVRVCQRQFGHKVKTAAAGIGGIRQQATDNRQQVNMQPPLPSPSSTRSHSHSPSPHPSCSLQHGSTATVARRTLWRSATTGICATRPAIWIFWLGECIPYKKLAYLDKRCS